MSISSYSSLVTAINDWLDRDDLSARCATFIQLAEARLNRLLEDPEMEVTATATVENGEIILPDDFGQMVSISFGQGPIGGVGPAEFAGFRTVQGDSRLYTLTDGVLLFAPSMKSATVTMTYHRRLPALTAAAPTNWLLALAPDVYLYGALVQASAFLAEDDRVSGWKAIFDESIAELRTDASRRKWGAGPIAPRIHRP